MNEERRIILEMLQAGAVTLEEAERLMEALPTESAETKAAPEMDNSSDAPNNLSGISPKRILVRVTEGDKTKVNIKVPFSLVRMGLKLGQTFGVLGAKYSADYSAEVEMLKSIDIDELLSSLSDGEISLPYTMVDVDDDEKGQHVQVVLE